MNIGIKLLVSAFVIGGGLFFILADKEFLWEFTKGQGDPPKDWATTTNIVGGGLILLMVIVFVTTP